MEASEDGRFVFAGLLRGSSEMLALDITELPRWGTLPIGEVGCVFFRFLQGSVVCRCALRVVAFSAVGANSAPRWKRFPHALYSSSIALKVRGGGLRHRSSCFDPVLLRLLLRKQIDGLSLCTAKPGVRALVLMYQAARSD